MPDVSFTELPGRRVLVRRFRPEDVAEFVAYRSDAEVARYQSWDTPYPPEQGERFVAQMMTAHPDTPGEWFQFAVALRATGQLIGDCAAMPRADDPRQCEIGFTIAPRYQGRGYATEAVRLLVGYLFARGWLELTDDPASVLVIRPAEFDRKAVDGSWRRGVPAKLGLWAAAGGHGPALLAAGVLPVRRPAP